MSCIDDVWLIRIFYFLIMIDNGFFLYICGRKSEFRVLKSILGIWLNLVFYDSGYFMRFFVLGK